MSEKVQQLRNDAQRAKILYMRKEITRQEAVSKIKPYIEYFNYRSEIIAKKYNQRPKYLSLAAYLR